MGKFVSPLLGYNNNVRHKNRVFHIQTEDSGINHPHIITHLFMDGGRILKSVKTSYAEHVGTEKMNETVRGMMKDQHKAMFIALRDGQFDHLFDGAPGGKPSATKPEAAKAPSVHPAAAPAKADVPPADVSAAGAAAGAATPARSEAAPITDGGAAAAPPAAPPQPQASAPDAPPSSKSPPTQPERPAVDLAAAAAAAGASLPPQPYRTSDTLPPSSAAIRTAASGPPTATQTVPAAPPTFTVPPPVVIGPGAASGDAPPSVRDLTLDFDALERAAHETSPSLFHGNDLPPPPQSLFARSASGAYRGGDGEADPRAPSPGGSRRPDPREEPATARPPSSKPVAGTPAPGAGASPRPPPPSAPQGQRGTGEQRYAPARPAAIFGANANRPAPPSIFSDELISDKSLDEVILSYLAEDLEPPRRK